MATKKQTKVATPVAGFHSQLSHINEELKSIQEKTSIWVDVEPEVDSIADALNALEKDYEDFQENVKDLTDELKTMTEERDQIQKEYEDMPDNRIQSFGEIRWEADNLVDRQIMEQLELCFKAGRQHELLLRLQNISKEFGTSQLIPSN